MKQRREKKLSKKLSVMLLFHHFCLVSFAYFKTSRYWYLEFVLIIVLSMENMIYCQNLPYRQSIFNEIAYFFPQFTDSCRHVLSRKIVIWRVTRKNVFGIFVFVFARTMCFISKSPKMLLSLQDFRKKQPARIILCQTLARRSL